LVSSNKDPAPIVNPSPTLRDSHPPSSASDPRVLSEYQSVSTLALPSQISCLFFPPNASQQQPYHHLNKLRPAE
ncbi:hypothetical protein, partial [Listeria monocytogenes]|uniref:hypothetical protein n=1 Tax=Listeria monocytogenes TaxID=1639 RepID=UPI001C0AC614